METRRLTARPIEDHVTWCERDAEVVLADDANRLVAVSRVSVRDRAPRLDRGKRLFDIVFSIVALLLVAPLCPFIIAAIWIEDGRPFLFRQTRQMHGGRAFSCYKFRTMCRDAETHRGGVAAENICDGPHFHIEDDPRLLKVGRLLRRFHLDELPQFINVLLGQMSVVGPRPSPERENRCCPAWRDTRLSLRPGVTGLWQVRRTRAPGTDFQEWIRYDLDYAERRCWRLDLWIVGLTALQLIPIRGRRAAAAAAAVDSNASPAR